MIRFVFSIIFFLSWFSGRLICEKVHQSPSDVLCKPKESVSLTCRHKISNYDTILWYQRSYGDSSLKLIGYAQYSSIKEFEPSYKGHFNLTGNGEDDVTLKILQARQDQDSAEYFCAASKQSGGGGQAFFGNGTKLTVLETDIPITRPVVKILNETSCKEKVTLVCLAENFYPDHVRIKWTLGSEEITKDVATDPYATKDNKMRMFHISSRLQVSKKEFKPKSKFKCIVTFYTATDKSEEIHAEITGTGGDGYDPENYLKSSQTISLAYGVFIAKSALYGFIILVFVCVKGSSGKRIN